MTKKTVADHSVVKDDSNVNDAGRRNAIKGIALAGLAVAVTPAVSLAQTVTGNPTARQLDEPLIDPRTRFPNDQPAQRQAWPGRQSAMTPKPDCGETSYRGSGRLAGRKALITGGDSGIGRAVAVAFAREGADVAINYLPEEEADAREVITIIRQEGRQAVAIPGDIRTEEFCRNLVARAASELGGLDILVSNAGYGWFLPDILEHPSDKFDQTIKTNLYAPFWLSKAAIAVMKPGSSIVFTNSVTAFLPADAFLDYSATKAALVAFTNALAQQVAKRGIRVNGVAPGAIWTPMQVYFGAPDHNVQNLNAITPIGRMGQPVEMAPLYVTLAEETGSFITGSTWSADGGRH
ncbi:MAG: SDR family oxidoreductase [Verrucomicrobiales bacterium]|jgi:NAD(P)-dependent dehydrogenase (short-subunit alcohol dehydrogenase family)|nr:SDR family oxidoreductase [Verrucomicrobiales bacterium]